MSHYRRKKPRRQVKCMLCTDARNGNSLAWGSGRNPVIAKRAAAAQAQVREYLTA